MARHVWVRLPRETVERVSGYDVDTIGILGRDCRVIAHHFRKALGRHQSLITDLLRRPK